MRNFFNSRHWKVFVVTCTIVGSIFFASLLGEVFLLLVMSLVMTMLLKPLVDYFENKGIPRSAGILTLYVALAGIIVFAFINIYPVVVFQLSSLSSLTNSNHLSLLLKQTAVSISETMPFIKADLIAEKLNTLLSGLARTAEDSLTSALSLAASIIIVPFLTFFLLNDYYKMQKALLENVPNKYFEMALNVVHSLDRQISKYIRGVCIDSLAVAILYVIAFQIFGVQYATVLGLIAGIANIIPLAGPIIGAVPVLIVSIIQFGDFRMVLPIVISTVLVRQLDDIFIQPNVYGKLLHMHPLTVMIVILLGGELLGILGMVLAIPIYTVISVTARETNWGLKNYRITESHG
ncbi:MAG: AI-2E family transporter [Bacteroidota bacterium]